MFGMLAQKIGMTAVFTEEGKQIPVTVARISGNIVVGKKTNERDGYTALVVGFGERRVKTITKPQAGVFRKAGLVETRGEQEFVKRHVKEFRIDAATLAKYEIGQTIDAAEIFKAGEKADVTGTSKGHGFTGVMVRHNFKGTKASHGVHEYFRHGGSIGMCTSPARVQKNKKMPGQHGNKRCTVQNISIVEIMAEEGLILLKGGVPGANGGLLRIARPVKG